MSAGPRLACGHVAATVERLRQGDEHWCSVCCDWQVKK